MRPSLRRLSTPSPAHDDRADGALRSSSREPQRFEMFGPYVVFEQLGCGGMASVHRAEAHIGGARRRVALKRLLPHAAMDPDLLRSFVHEAQVATSLHHRNIAEVYETGRIGDDYFLAMEHVAGPTVRDLFRLCAASIGPMPFPIVLKLLSQVCDALAYAHAHRGPDGKPLHLVHRDVSPSNIVISGNGVVKLIDFGVAKSTSTNTQAGILKGKLGYIAPEYVRGSLDHRADLWAVGVVAWELLANRRLFVADDDMSMLKLVLNQPIDPPSVHNPDIPAELDAIVMTALHRDPAERWQNAAAMRNALLGIDGHSTNAELLEWVQWGQSLDAKGLRPPRGSKPPQMKAQMMVVAAPGMIAAPIAPPTPPPTPLAEPPAPPSYLRTQLGVAPPTPPTQVRHRPSLTEIVRTRGRNSRSATIGRSVDTLQKKRSVYMTLVLLVAALAVAAGTAAIVNPSLVPF